MEPANKVILLFWVCLILAIVFGVIGVFQPYAIGPALVFALIAGVAFESGQRVMR